MRGVSCRSPHRLILATQTIYQEAPERGAARPEVTEMNPSTMKKRWAIVGAAAVLGVAGATTAAALNDPAPRAESSAAVALDSAPQPDSGAGSTTADPSPESADSPNESARDTAGSAQSADSPGDANYDPSPESADSPNESAHDTAGSAQSADSPNDANYVDDQDDNTPNDNTPNDADDDADDRNDG
jgi:hypothetical protein